MFVPPVIGSGGGGGVEKGPHDEHKMVCARAIKMRGLFQSLKEKERITSPRGCRPSGLRRPFSLIISPRRREEYIHRHTS